MKVAYVCSDPGVPVWGSKGCSVHVQEILNAMLRRGFEVDLFARRTGNECPEHLQSVNLVRLDKPAKTNSLNERELRLIESNRMLRVMLERHGPYDLVYERYALWSHAAIDYAKDSGVPSVLEVNAPLVREQSTHRQLLDQVAATRLTQRAFRGATSVIAVSSSVADYVDGVRGVREVSGARGNLLPAYVVPNGVAVGRFEVARRQIQRRWERRIQGVESSPLVVGFTGTLRPWHGMQSLGAAFRRFHATYPNSELLIVGDGPARAELLDELGPAAKSTHITGKVEMSRVPELLARMDIAVAPYPNLDDFYFSPLKIFEYMAAGLPVVASRIGDIPNYLSHDESAFLVEPGDPETLAAALRHCAANPAESLAMGTAGFRLAESKHSWDSVLDTALASVNLADDLKVGASPVAKRVG